MTPAESAAPINVGVCEEPLSRGDGDLPYADGSTPYGVVVCPDGHENSFDFGTE